MSQSARLLSFEALSERPTVRKRRSRIAVERAEDILL